MSTLPRHQRPTNLKKFLFGAPYYPEHWNEADRELDAQRMKDAGVNVARMAEFAWDVMEPSKGQYDFSLFDQTIKHLGEHGVDSFLCTPTATPPRWLTADRSEWMRVTSEGVAMKHGNRQHVCTNNEEFRLESQKITRAMAEHYRDNPNVIGWQTDNEFYCHIAVCYCNSCKKGFQAWLEKKYQSIDELNTRWGNRFWAQTYDRYDQIELPRHGSYPAPGNPSHELDHSRYLSESIEEFQKQQIDILREVQPKWWITHNGIFDKIDHWDFARDLDFYAVDVYPGFAGASPENFVWGTIINETCRMASGGYIVPEQSGGPGGQLDYMHPTCEPGQMRLWAYQSIACGADGILHFRWRTCRFGAEIYWNGIIDQDNITRRRYEEFSQEGRELQKIGSQILGSVKEIKVGILSSYENDEMFQSQTNGFAGPNEQAKEIFGEGLRRHLPIGYVDPRDSFEGLEVIIMPTHLAEDLDLTQKLDAFVKKGGLLFVSARSYTRNKDNHVLSVTPPASLSPILGITREEEGRIVAEMDEFNLFTESGVCYTASKGYEVIQLDQAESLATWNVGAEDRHPHFAQDKCGLSVHAHGEGKAYYFGSYIDKVNSGKIIDLLIANSSITPFAEGAPTVEMAVRHKQGERFLFLLNHTVAEQVVTEIPCGKDLIADKVITGSETLEPFGVRVIKLE